MAKAIYHILLMSKKKSWKELLIVYREFNVERSYMNDATPNFNGNDATPDYSPQKPLQGADLLHDRLLNNPDEIIAWANREIKEYQRLIKLIEKQKKKKTK